MSAHKINHMLTLVTVTCCSCSTVFAMCEELTQRRRNDGEGFFCPNGHKQHYIASEVDRLRQKLEQQTRIATQQADRAARAERQVSAQKGQVTRLKNRAKAGVCPCCNRTFHQLAKHMASKHPEYGNEQELRP